MVESFLTQTIKPLDVIQTGTVKIKLYFNIKNLILKTFCKEFFIGRYHIFLQQAPNNKIHVLQCVTPHFLRNFVLKIRKPLKYF